MKGFLKKVSGNLKYKKPKFEHPSESLTITDTSGSPPGTEPLTSTSTITADSASAAGAAIATAQVFQATASARDSNITYQPAHELDALSSDFTLATINDPAPVVQPLAVEKFRNKSPYESPDVMQVNMGSADSERNTLQTPPTRSQHSQATSSSGFIPANLNTNNLLITGGTFNFHTPPADTSERKIRIPVPQKPNPSIFFTGRENVLDKLRKIFVYTNSDSAKLTRMTRRSCLLWGMGGIGKTQICLKFIEEVYDSFSHVFWVDASSYESITTCIKGISSTPAAKSSGIDGSVESVLQWISHIQEAWLIVFDNADEPPPEVVAKFIPSGNRGNILITSRNRTMGRLVSFENSIEINEMEESDAVALLLKASHLVDSAEHLQDAKNIVIELGCIPLAVDHAGSYIEAGKCEIDSYLRLLSLHHRTLMSDAAFTGASSYD